jgi:membrane protease YdiL (CAAX protease family)
VPVLVFAYIAVVLTVDTLAVSRVKTPIDWSMFQWFLPKSLAFLERTLGLHLDFLKQIWMSRLDVFKLLFWFVIPFVFCLRHMDWGALGIRGWKRMDYIILAVLAVLGLGAVFLIPHVPQLRYIYASLAEASPEQKWIAFRGQLVWVASWLIGWEFLHRYVLLRQAQRLWPVWGWLLVPFSEGVYHLQKPALEALGMVVFSIILTQWAIRRKNVLLPFLAHLIIEVELILFLLVF